MTFLNSLIELRVCSMNGFGLETKGILVLVL